MCPNRSAHRGRWPRARVEEIQRGLLDLIVQSRLAPGAALPPEAELAELLDVGRNSLREGVKALQALGVLEIRHGSGTFVAPSNLDPLKTVLSFRTRHSLRVGGDSARELVEVRAALETGLLPNAIEAVSEADLESIAEAFATMETADLGAQMRAADMAFHEALFAPVRNSLLSQILRSFWLAYKDIAEVLEEHSIDRTEIVEKHRRIAEAVTAGDSGEAVEAMRDHFVEIQHRLSV